MALGDFSSAIVSTADVVEGCSILIWFDCSALAEVVASGASTGVS